MPNTRVVVTRYGGPEVLTAVEEPLRSPRAGEVRVRVAAAGVALADVMRREGVYPGSPTPPFTPGYDVVGVVDEVGDGVDGFSPGDRVAVFFNGIGGYASHVWATVDDLYPVPVQLDPVLAVASILNYVTAYQMLHRIARVAAGESILVTVRVAASAPPCSTSGIWRSSGCSAPRPQANTHPWPTSERCRSTIGRKIS